MKGKNRIFRKKMSEVFLYVRREEKNVDLLEMLNWMKKNLQNIKYPVFLFFFFLLLDLLPLRRINLLIRTRAAFLLFIR